MFKIDWRVASLYFCLAVIIQCVKEEEIQLVRRYQMECISETRVDPDDVSKIKHGYWGINRDRVQLLKDWTLCVFLKYGLMTPQGVYKIDYALSKVPDHDKEDVEKLIDTCLSTKAIPAAEIAYKFAQCYQKAKGNYTVTILL